MYIYVIGPYSHSTAEEREAHVAAARGYMAYLLRRGHTPICAYAMFEGMEHMPGLDYEDFMRADFELMDVCHCAVVLPGYEHSAGSIREIRRAEAEGLPLYFDLTMIPEGTVDTTDTGNHLRGANPMDDSPTG